MKVGVSEIVGPTLGLMVVEGLYEGLDVGAMVPTILWLFPLFPALLFPDLDEASGGGGGGVYFPLPDLPDLELLLLDGGGGAGSLCPPLTALNPVRAWRLTDTTRLSLSWFLTTISSWLCLLPLLMPLLSLFGNS